MNLFIIPFRSTSWCVFTSSFFLHFKSNSFSRRPRIHCRYSNWLFVCLYSTALGHFLRFSYLHIVLCVCFFSLLLFFVKITKFSQLTLLPRILNSLLFFPLSVILSRRNAALECAGWVRLNWVGLGWVVLSNVLLFVCTTKRAQSLRLRLRWNSLFLHSFARQLVRTKCHLCHYFDEHFIVNEKWESS